MKPMPRLLLSCLLLAAFSGCQRGEEAPAPAPAPAAAAVNTAPPPAQDTATETA